MFPVKQLRQKLASSGTGLLQLGHSLIIIRQSFKFKLTYLFTIYRIYLKKNIVNLIEICIFEFPVFYFPIRSATEIGASKKDTQSAIKAAARVKRVFLTPTAP